MSLIKQLWTAVIAIVLLAFISGFLVSGIQARSYYEEQLSVKNIDAATSMALTLSPMDKDPITVELALSSQFDTGHYHVIKLIAPEGEILFIKEGQIESLVPQWFANLIGFEIPVGVAQVQDGWNLYGTLYVESEAEYALAALWEVSLGLLFWFSVIALVCGLVGTAVMYVVNRPFERVIEQAEALGERRFITSSEPKTMEFKRLVRAMNLLTNRVKGMLEKEASKYDELREKSQLDPVMKIANRQSFIATIRARLNQQQPSQDALLVMRLQGLEQMNIDKGRVETDAWLVHLIKQSEMFLDAHTESFSHYRMGRLNGRDIAILLADSLSMQTIAEQLFAYLLQHASLDKQLPIQMVGEQFSNQSDISQLLAGIDQRIGLLETTGQQLDVSTTNQQKVLFTTREQWRDFLQQAINNERVFAEFYPVFNLDGQLLQQEAMLRIATDDRNLMAFNVIGWARRVGLLPQLEMAVIKYVLLQLGKTSCRYAINLSIASLKSQSFHIELLLLLNALEPEQRARLVFDFDEYSVVREPLLFANFVQRISKLGAKVGLQAVGKQFGQIQELERLGLDYLKVDAALVVTVEQAEVQQLLTSLCTLGHSLGFVMIAEGVQKNTDKHLLTQLGFDAITGPGAQA